MTTTAALQYADWNLVLSLSLDSCGTWHRKLGGEKNKAASPGARRSVVVFVPGPSPVWCITTYVHADVGVPGAKGS